MANVSCKKTEGLTLADAINLLLSKDFCVTYLNFSRRNIACINDAKNGAIISYDGIVYKCTGRDFIEELSEGTLSENGCIIWNESKVKNDKRLKHMTILYAVFVNFCLSVGGHAVRNN